MIDIRLETLIKVAEEKNFTKAAMALNLLNLVFLTTYLLWKMN